MMKSIYLSLIFVISFFKIVAQGNVTIVEPNKPRYYFSEGHPPSYYSDVTHTPLPAMYDSQTHPNEIPSSTLKSNYISMPARYDISNDIVWLKNDKIKIGINLKRGGQIAWASKADATTNLVYNGYDGGFQVTLDAYQLKDGYSQNGKYSRSGYDEILQYDGATQSPTLPFASYNTTMGGDFRNHSQSLIDYHQIPNGYYVKFRPIFYTMNSEFSQTYIEAKYTIINNSVKIEYRYTSFRTDGQWNGGGFDGAAVPACFIVNTLNKYRTYNGNSPWNSLPTTGGNLPNETAGQSSADAHATEFWGMVYDEQHPESGIGIYNDNEGGSSQYFQFKQKEVYPTDGPGTEFNSGYTYFHSAVPLNIPNANRGNYTKNFVCYLIVGSENEIRNRAVEIHNGTSGGSTLTLNQSSWSPSASANTQSVSVNSNNAWSVSSSDNNWLTVSPASGSNNGSFTIGTTANGSTSSRAGTITVSASGVSSQTVNVTQAGTAGTGGTGGGTLTDRTESGLASDDEASNLGGEGQSEAFDNRSNTKWLVFNSTGNIAYDFGGEDAYKINKYTVTSANDASDRDPKNWNFQGSNDGTNWTTVDTQKNQYFGSRFEVKPYPISNTTAYKQYRLNVTENNGADKLQIGEIQMFGLTGTGEAGGGTGGDGGTGGGENPGGGDNPGGNPSCSYTNGQILTEWHGNEIVRAYICGTKYYAKNDAGYFKSRSWLTGTGRFTTTELACFEEVNPGCGGARIASSLEESELISIYPNPTYSKIKVSFVLQNDETVWFNLSDSQGKNLQLSDFEGKSGRNEVELDLQNYTSGIYFINLQYNQKQEIRKVIKLN